MIYHLVLAFSLVFGACGSTDRDLREQASEVSAIPTTGDTEYEAAFTTVLSDVLSPEGLVFYDRLAVHPLWPTVLSGIENFDFSKAGSDAERLAFWLNAYNVHMLNLVAQRPGRKRILGIDLGRVFFKRDVRVAGRMLTLDDIEHGLLRGEDDELSGLAPSVFDPRIHVALNCAAISCPRLWPEAYSADRLEAQLDNALRNFVNSPAHFSMDDGRLVASSLLKWYGSDFDLAGPPAGDYLLAVMSPERPAYQEIASVLRGRTASEIADQKPDFDYDWKVNRAN